jgi:hypothetical protein
MLVLTGQQVGCRGSPRRCNATQGEWWTMNEWLTALLSLLGVTLGAGLQFASSRAAERARHGEELQAQAYAEYLRAVAAAGHQRSDEDFRNARRDAADAKARIAVYGSARVVHSLAGSEQAGAVLSNAESCAAFISLVNSMRGASAAVSKRDLGFVLLGASSAKE